MASITTFLTLAAESSADSNLSAGTFAMALLTLLSLASIVAPRGVWMLTSSWRYRNSEAMEPSARFFRVTRLSAAISFILWSSFLTAGVFPGDADGKIYAALITASVGLVLTVVVMIVSAIVRGARHSRGKRDAEPPVNELSEAGYADQYIGVAISAVALFVILVFMAGIPGQAEANRVEADQNSQDREDLMFGNYGIVYPNVRPVTDAVKAGTFVTTPSTYLVANSATEEPAYLWEMTSIEGNLAGSRTIDQAVEQSDLVIMTKKSCDVKSFVVVETDDTVAIGIELVVPTVPGIPKPSAAPTVEVLERVCGSAPIGSPGSYYFVNLRGGPLGDRTVTTLDGEPVPQDADPASR